MTDNIAVLDGYTREVIGEAGLAAHDGCIALYLLVKPETDLGERFRAWDMDAQEYITVNGWLFSFDEVTANG